jgi:hypothetical protein
MYKLSKENKKKEEELIKNPVCLVKKIDDKFSEEKGLVERKKDEVDFLRDNSEIFDSCVGYLKPHERVMLAYNVLKYYIVLLRKFKKTLNEETLS